MIQNIAPKRLDIGYFPDSQPESDSVVFGFRGREVLCRCTAEELFPVFGDFSEISGLRYLFAVSGRRYFLAEELPESGGFAYMDIRQLRHESGAENADILALFTAHHLGAWYRSNRFCGSCGGSTSDGKTERSLVCESCGKVVYPRIDPAVIVGVTNGDKLLITRYARGYAHDALVAGFVEIGESLEDTVRREVMEEVGLEVRNIRYFKSQPWGMANNLLAGFFCDVSGNSDIKLDENELKSAVWIDRADITGQPDDISLTNEMMMTFKYRPELIK